MVSHRGFSSDEVGMLPHQTGGSGMKHMGHASNNMGGAGEGGWRTPALYLFSGVAGMLVLIGIASMLLLCFWWRLGNTSSPSPSTEPSTEEDDVKKESVSVDIVDKLHDDKVLVIMPGHANPTFVAKQISD